jgi:ribosome biogenesis GTPase / thiamine phosphate phosphatase
MALGWEDSFQRELELLRGARGDLTLRPARVVVEHRGAYELIAEDGLCWAEPTGRLRHQALDKLDLPAVGDWVALQADGRIDALLPRKSAFVRKAAGDRTDPQVIAANIDRVFIVTSANTEFNPRRIERYIAAIRESGASPVLVINKTDLCEDVEKLIESLGSASVGLSVARVSALEQRGLDQLSPFLGPQITVALVGSSGVGKSTLANWMLGRDAQDTAGIREHDAHGRHTTTHRELLALPGGGALIDTPGMREFALWSEGADLSGSFGDIEALSGRCRFVDCQHRGQPGCAIDQALETGTLDPERLEHFFKLEREIAYHRERGSLAARQAIKSQSKSRVKAMRQRKKGPEGGKLH